MPAHHEEDPTALREARRRELADAQKGGGEEDQLAQAEADLQRKIDRTLEKVDDENLSQWLDESWLRYRDARAHAEARVAEESKIEEELGGAAEQLEEAWVAGAIAWLKEHWGTHKPCPYCGNSEWTVGLPAKLADELPPHFTVTCNNCANTALINAVWAGLMDEGDFPG